MIEILNYERATKNKVIGYVDILIPPMTIPKMIIRRIAHLQSGDRKWFNLPTFTKDKGDGSQQYLRYWQFELDAHNGQLLEKLGDRVKDFCYENKIPDIEPLNFQTTQNFEPEQELPF